MPEPPTSLLVPPDADALSSIHATEPWTNQEECMFPSSSVMGLLEWFGPSPTLPENKSLIHACLTGPLSLLAKESDSSRGPTPPLQLVTLEPSIRIICYRINSGGRTCLPMCIKL